MVARVAMPSWEPWNSRIAARSMSVRASPEITRKESPRNPRGVANAARGAEQLLLLAVGELDPEPRAVAEVTPDHAPGTSAGWRSPRRSRAGTAAGQMCSITGRLSTGTIGFGTVVGDRAQPGAQPGCEDHGAHLPTAESPRTPPVRTRERGGSILIPPARAERSCRRAFVHVPWSQLLRYFVWTSVSSSISTPFEASLSRAISASISRGTG